MDRVSFDNWLDAIRGLNASQRSHVLRTLAAAEADAGGGNVTDPQACKLSERAARKVSRIYVPQCCLDQSCHTSGVKLLRSRVFTLLVLMEPIEQFEKSKNRADAFLVVITASFCWQFIRALGGVSGDDKIFLMKKLPQDHAMIDQDSRNYFFARQIEIVDDASWIFTLHSFIRHPGSVPDGNLWLLKDPVSEENAIKLIRGARGIRQVLRNVVARLEK